MAQQPWNIGGAGSTGLPSSLDSSKIGGSSKGLPPDVVLLGPRDERESRPASAPAPMPRLEANRIEKPDLRPRPASYMPAPRKNPRTKRTVIGLSALVLICVGIPSIAYLRSGSSAPATTPATAPVARTASAPAAQPPAAGIPATAVMGSATIISRPEGAQVLIDGIARGVTPLTVTLPLGTYTMELQNGPNKRSLPLVVESGFVVRQYVDLAPTAGDAMGRLEISSDPAGAQVVIDGTPRGVTPLTIGTIEPGQHRVTITGADGTVNRTVNVAAGATASVVATLTSAGAAAGGWVSIAAPFEMQVLEKGQVIGSSAMDRLMLPAGKHELTLVSDAFGLSTNVTVQVPAGRTVNVPVVLPKNTLSINALPWADVWLDGQPLGTTPLGNISVNVGNHEVIWRHPQLGERRQTIKVTAGAPIRAGVDFSK
jgi:hypothetical protein